jgi:hypothetical protein
LERPCRLSEFEAVATVELVGLGKWCLEIAEATGCVGLGENGREELGSHTGALRRRVDTDESEIPVGLLGVQRFRRGESGIETLRAARKPLVDNSVVPICVTPEGRRRRRA